ncbi:hypothetical protein I6B53_02905 [Schaalia sp. 19OD2882]|uniref:hypothetical protein n=1 Tax=Schaalia sp. 19OD2882 TaxID=2794089 RepID=UPI001C1ECC9D|nr:hypothetical protein I6B53_02905 [Schaalia sp. 19OD2882]
MSETPVIVAQPRDEFGKGAARRARRAGLVPGALYGHGIETRHIDLPGHELFLIVRDHRHAIVEVKLDGKAHLAQIREVQRHPVSRALLHVDLVLMNKAEAAAAEKAEEEAAAAAAAEMAHAVELAEEAAKARSAAAEEAAAEEK